MKANLKKIEGNWDAGYALDKHSIRSTFTGNNEYGHPTFETERTEVGEAVYQLKYQSDWLQVEPLADAVVEHIVPKFGAIGLVIPVPASRTRVRQPVNEVAEAVAKKVEVHSFERIVTKLPAVGTNVSLKDLSTKEEKISALEDRFTITDVITENGLWSVLVVDDLFDTGATMEAVCKGLRNYAKIDKIYVATLTWK